MTRILGLDMSTGEDRTVLAIMKGNTVEAVIDRDELNAKNARRKKERQWIAAMISHIIGRHNADVERDEDSTCLTLKFSLNGVGAMIHIDGLHGGSWSLIHWHNTGSPVRDFSKRFVSAIGDRSPWRPHHKATSHPGDWYSLAMMLDAGLCLAFANQAFEASYDL